MMPEENITEYKGDYAEQKGFSAKKSLGQNFLHAPHIVGKIVHTARIEAGLTVLEVGPGKGVLTEALVAQCEVLGGISTNTRVIAIEKDDRAIGFLQEKFVNAIQSGVLTIIHGDILEYDPNKELAGKEYIIVANIPYYITGEFIRNFLEGRDGQDSYRHHQPKRMVLLVQKEVAQRIVAREQGKPSKESILSISVKAFGEPTYIETVPARHFRPVPKVDSAILLIDKVSRAYFMDGLPIQTFFSIVKRGFAHKRKVLISNLGELEDRKTLESVWKDIDLDLKARAEDLTLIDWKKLTKNLLSDV